MPRVKTCEHYLYLAAHFQSLEQRRHDWNLNIKEKITDKSNYDGAYWRKASAFRWRFAVTIFGDDFRWWIMKRLSFSGELGRWLVVYAQGCPCQMGVVDWGFDRHPRMLLTTIVFEPGMFTKFEPGYSGSLVKQNLSHRVVRFRSNFMIYPIGSMYAIYANIYHQYTPNVSIYTIHGSYGTWKNTFLCLCSGGF